MSELARVVAALAGGGLLAAGVVATLARLRRVQQHRRRHGRRIKLPTGDAAGIEMGLRAAQAPNQDLNRAAHAKDDPRDPGRDEPTRVP
jgi:hypothetical protein